MGLQLLRRADGEARLACKAARRHHLDPHRGTQHAAISAEKRRRDYHGRVGLWRIRQGSGWVSPDRQTLNSTRPTDASRPGPALNAYNDLHALFGDTLVAPPAPDAPVLPVECLLVIDSGFSHTT